jgi:trigger factor
MAITQEIKGGELFMKTYKSIIILFAVLLALLTGCGEKGDSASFSYSNGIDDNGFLEGITAADYVELYDYNSFAVPDEIYNISDDEVQSKISEILQDYSTTEQITERAVENGDTVNIDYVGSIDGVEFEGGSTEGAGTEVTVGVTSYIDDFIEQLIGHKPGETFEVNVTFPEDYGQDDLNGKDAVFVTTVNYIAQTVNPELDDAFVAENLSTEYGWKTVSEMKSGVYADLQKEAIQNYIYDYLTESVTVKSVPDKLTEYQKNAMIQYYQDSADSLDMELEEFLTSYVGVSSLDELIESNSENNAISAKLGLVIQAIAEDVEITVSDEDVANYFKEQMGTDDYSQYEENFGKPYLKQAVLSQKVMDYLVEHTVLV